MPAHGVKTCWKRGDTAPHILNLRASGNEWSNSHPGRFTPGKEHRHSLNRTLAGRFREKKNHLPLPGFEPQLVQPIAYSSGSDMCPFYITAVKIYK